MIFGLVYTDTILVYTDTSRFVYTDTILVYTDTLYSHVASIHMLHQCVVKNPLLLQRFNS